MRKVLIIAVLGMMMFAFGCGNNAETEFVQVEIEKIEDIITPAVEEVSAEGVSDESFYITDKEESVYTDLGIDSNNNEESPDGSESVDAVGKDELTAITDEVEESVDDTAPLVEESANTINAPAGDKETSTIYVAVTGTTSGEILEAARSDIELNGYKLEILTQNNYDAPNELVASDQIDASFCINQAYMDSYNTVHGTNLSVAERVYYEPYGLFAGKTKGLSKCPSKAVIAVPEGEIAMARTLYLLEQKGLIEVKSKAGYQACIDDIVSNKHNISFERYDADAGLPDSSKYDYYVADFNHVLVEGINPATALGYENRNSKLLDMFTIDLVTTEDKLENTKISILKKALNGSIIEQYIEDTYIGTVVDYR